MTPKYTALALALTALCSPALADGWQLDGDSSKLAFGSIKKDIVGEVHAFENLSGSVSSAGKVSIDIDLASVETWIDIRNERMIEHVFNKVPKATLEADIDMAQLEATEVGGDSLVDVTGYVNFLGTSTRVDTEMFVVRLSEDRVMVTTNEMIFLTTEELEIDAGIDKLKELAELPGITRAFPVTLRLMFDKSGDPA